MASTAAGEGDRDGGGKPDVQFGSGATFQLKGEDHTLANAVRFMLNKDPNVEFTGYSIPHPSEQVVNVRVQTTGQVSAQQALRQALLNIKDACAEIKERYQEAVQEAERAKNQEKMDED